MKTCFFSLLSGLLLCIPIQSSFGQIALGDGLVAHYLMDGNVRDTSGFKHHGVLLGPTLTHDRFNRPNRAYYFDGIDDYIRIPTSAVLDSVNQDYTLTAWIHMDDWYVRGADWAAILSKSALPSSSIQFRLVLQPDRIHLAPFNGCSSFFHQITFPLDQWIHIGLTKTANSLDLYLDGILVDSYPCQAVTTSTQADLEIGRDLSGFTELFHGSMDDIRIYNRAVSAGEMVAIMDQTEGISGQIYQDLNQNCQIDANEPLLPISRTLIIQPGNLVLQTQPGESWFVDSLPAGTYTATVDTSGYWRATCDPTVSFTVVNPDSFTQVPPIGMRSELACPAPNVAIHMPFMRRCFDKQRIYITASNLPEATRTLEDPYLIVTLDSLISVDSSTVPLFPLGGNQFRIELDDLAPGQSKKISLFGKVSCDAVRGQTLCLEAELFPAPPCALDSSPHAGNCPAPWDSSDLRIRDFCKQDSVFFKIINDGQDMACPQQVRIFLDGQPYLLDSLQLEGGASFSYAFAANGQTWRLEVDQHPYHPGNSQPSATVERCGPTVNWIAGLVTILPQDDADPVVDIFCGEVTGSFDPNDKTGFPIGVTDTNFIAPNQPLEYLIRFQNTGNDTAFTVVIRDTLEEDLNIFSVRQGAASHDYSFRMYGNRILEWTFNHILLPDSNVNEPASHGFVTFKVNQQTNLPEYQEITNRVGIYFDFNEPIITNTTRHTIKDYQFQNLATQNDLTPPSPFTHFTFYPNPTEHNLIASWEMDNLQSVNLQIFDIRGKSVLHPINHQTLSPGTHQIEVRTSDLSSGLYFIQLASENSQTTRKLIVR